MRLHPVCNFLVEMTLDLVVRWFKPILIKMSMFLFHFVQSLENSVADKLIQFNWIRKCLNWIISAPYEGSLNYNRRVRNVNIWSQFTFDDNFHFACDIFFTPIEISAVPQKQRRFASLSCRQRHAFDWDYLRWWNFLR